LPPRADGMLLVRVAKKSGAAALGGNAACRRSIKVE
jgi:hypothetical protein